MRNRGSNVIKGIMALMIAGIVVRIIGFIYRLPLTYLIGDDGNGIYGAGFQLYNFFFTVSTTGIPVAISKMVSERIALDREYEAYRVFRISIYLMMVVGIVTSLMLGFGAKWFSKILNYDRAYYTMISLSPTLFFTAIVSSYRGYFQGQNNMVPTAVSQIVEQLVKAVMTVFIAYLFINLGKSIEITAAGATFGTTLGAFAASLTLIYVLKTKMLNMKLYKKQKYETSTKILKTIIRLSIPVTIGASVITAGNLVDLFMIKSRLLSIGFNEIRASQLYGILAGKINTILNLPTVVTAAAVTAIVPSISASLARKEYNTIESKIRKVLRLTMLVIMPASIGLSILADPIIHMLFPSHPEGGYILSIGAYYIIFLALSQNITSIFQAIGRPEIPAVNLFIGVLIKIILNYYLIAIPRLNILGTQISSIICYLVTFVLNYMMLKKYIKFKFPLMDAIIKPGIASGFMAIGVIIVYNRTMNAFTKQFTGFKIIMISTVSAICVGAIIYVITSAVIGAIKKEDVKMFALNHSK